MERPRLRKPLVIASLVAAASLAVAGAATLGSTSAPPPTGVAGPGTFLGAFQLGSDNATPPPIGSLGANIGRSFGVNRVYANWDDVEPSMTVSHDIAAGAVPILSIAPRLAAGKGVPWTAIAGGTLDATIRAQAQGLASLHSPVILALGHEPELQAAIGTSSEFVAAWRHYVQVFRSSGATNVSFALILTSRSYLDGKAKAWYPGDDVVDLVAADGYNEAACLGGREGWRSFATIFTPMRTFAMAHGKQGLVAEFASTENPKAPTAKTQWIRDAQTTLQGWPEIRAAIYFDAPGLITACQFRLTSSSGALAAFASMASAPTFGAYPQVRLDAAFPTTGPAPMQADFSTVGSETMTGTTASWALDPGDGTAPVTGAGLPPAQLSHTYSTGSYTASLTLSDTAKRRARTTVQLVVKSPPGVYRTGGVTMLTRTSAAITGSVNPKGQPTTAQVVYGPTSQYGSSTPPVTVGSGGPGGDVRIEVDNLSPGTYHWRLTATNPSGTSQTPDAVFIVPVPRH